MIQTKQIQNESNTTAALFIEQQSKYVMVISIFTLAEGENHKSWNKKKNDETTPTHYLSLNHKKRVSLRFLKFSLGFRRVGKYHKTAPSSKEIKKFECMESGWHFAVLKVMTEATKNTRKGSPNDPLYTHPTELEATCSVQ